MPANTQPIFTLTPKVGVATITAANTNRDGLTGSYETLYTAGSNGGYVEKILCRSKGTCVATVARFFIVKSGGATAALVHEVTLAATSAIATAALTGYEVNLDVALEAGDMLKVAIGTTVSDGWAFTSFAGDY